MTESLNVGPVVEKVTYSGSQRRMNEYLHVSEYELKGLLSRLDSSRALENTGWTAAGAALGYFFDALSKDGLSTPQSCLVFLAVLLVVFAFKSSRRQTKEFESHVKQIKSEMWVWDETKNRYVPPCQ